MFVRSTSDGGPRPAVREWPVSVQWTSGAAGRLRLVDPDAGVRRTRRQDVHRVDHESAGAFVAPVVDLVRHLAEPRAGARREELALKGKRAPVPAYWIPP